MRAAPRRQSAFGSSDRRVRGRIIAALLRETGGMTLRSLTARLGDARVPRLVRALAEEGMVGITRGRVRLPTDVLAPSAHVQTAEEQGRIAAVSRP